MRDTTDHDLLPAGYYQALCPPVAGPPFTDPRELERLWGARWGSADEVGQLRVVLMRRPGAELERISQDGWDSGLDALVADDGGWYWTGAQPPDIARVRAQYDGLITALEAENIEIIYADALDPRFTKAMYTRDPLLSIPGGVIIGRLAPAMRRGEEASVARAVAGAGVPILHTIVGTGMVEGGSFVKLAPGLAAYGTSIRCNREGAEQLAQALRWLDVELITLPMSGFSIHLDGQLGMVDVDKAIVRAEGLPHWFIERLQALHIEPIWAQPGERWAVNCLAIRPGRVIITDDCPRTTEMLERRGVTVIPIPYDEIHRNGGGIHCSTVELLRDPA